MTFFAALPLIGDIIDKVVPDKNSAQKAKDTLALLSKQGQLDLLLGQLAINKEEAKHPSIFVSGWRPAVGWVCAFGLFFNVIVHPVMSIWVAMKPVDPAMLYPVLIALLGMGAYRTYEKMKGVARE